MKRDCINTMLCIPGDNMPPDERNILARVEDNGKIMYFQFGRDTSKKVIMERIPILVGEYYWKNRRRKGA